MEDVYEAYKFSASKYKRLTCFGDSAGGNLCAALALRLRDTQMRQFDALVLAYPATTDSHTRKSFPSGKECESKCWILTAAQGQKYESFYTQSRFNISDHYIFPLADARQLKGLPPTLVITGQYDLLRDDGIKFYEKMRLWTQAVEHLHIENTVHGFLVFSEYSMHKFKVFEHMKRYL